jgi:hypothetical protein
MHLDNISLNHRTRYAFETWRPDNTRSLTVALLPRNSRINLSARSLTDGFMQFGSSAYTCKGSRSGPILEACSYPCSAHVVLSIVWHARSLNIQCRRDPGC